MNESEQQLQQINIDIEDAKKHIELADALDRLHKNDDFRKVFIENYFKEEASRVVLLRADPTMQGEREQKDIENIITSIGGLRQHFATVYGLGNMSARAMEEHQSTREELLEETLAPGEEVIQ